MASRSESIEKRLDALRLSGSDIQAAAAISVDGLMIAGSLPDDLAEELVAAMSAAMLALGERIAQELGRGALDQVFIKGDTGYVLMAAVNNNAVLTVLVGEEAKLGLALLDMQRTAEALRELV
ncbi:MAG: roadblock/LC7 domain-containing protein [Anaerolineae bacterium]|nr:roadblock/LC7 domain-containing protein [Anaerolineae bacterium]